MTQTHTMTLSPGTVAATAAARVDILPPRARFSLRLRTESRLALGAALNLPLPDRIGGRAAAGTREVLCLGPDEWLLLASEGEADTIVQTLEAVYPAHPHSLTEVSDREVTIGVEGPEALALLAMGCPRDLAALPVGQGRRTVFDGVSVVLWRDGDARFRLDVWRSFAPHLLDLLVRGCRELAA